MFDMEVIVRRQDQERCASITCMIRHYVARRAQVSEAHPHNADERAPLNSSSLPTNDASALSARAQEVDTGLDPAGPM